MEIGNMVFGHSRGEVPIGQGEWQAKFMELMNVRKDVDWDHSFEKEVFLIRPYFWGECMCDEDGPVDPKCQAHWPNFVYKPTGYELMWYKYPLRDSYANREVTFEEFCAMIDECKRSIQE